MIKTSPSKGSARQTAWERVGLSVAVLASYLPMSAAQAQTAPNQTPPGATALAPSPQSRFAFPPAQGLEAPTGAAEIRFRLSDIAVEGQFDDLDAQSTTLEADYVGREISVAEIYLFAAQLQQAYFAAGYPLARVLVPPQDLDQSGRVRLRVVDGFVEGVDTSQLPARVRERVASVLSPVVGAARPTRAQLERRLLIAGDTVGLALTSTLTPGAQVGATILVVSGEHRAFEGVVAADDRASRQLGGGQLTGSIAVNSALGWGERFFATLAFDPSADAFTDASLRQFASVGMTLPLGHDGLTFGARVDYSVTRPGEDVAAQLLESEYTSAELSLSYPLIRSRANTLEASLRINASNDAQKTGLGGPTLTTLSQDRLRVVRIGLEGAIDLRGDRRLGYGITFSRGLDGLGARTGDDATPLKPLTRVGADAEFSALDASFSFMTPGPGGSGVSLSMRGKHAFGDPLLRSEQFSPSGWDGVSGPAPGLLIGDNGVVARLEIDRPVRGDGFFFAPYIFGVGAEVRLESPTILEREQTDLHGAGAGVRFGAAPRARGGYGLSATLEWSRTDSDVAELDRDWTSAAITWRF